MNLDKLVRRTLTARAHHLKPVVLVGQHGVTEAVAAETDRALSDHELIKIRFRGHGRDDRRAAVERLCETLDAALVNELGGTVILFRERPEKPARPRTPAPRPASRNPSRARPRAGRRAS